ncbi:peptide alpha-N-acetyltransferase [Apiospora phragmitis]|uniref:Peptide alpha-N-acetyltransferase n=1 Tax=Apiospora phragmitis TaxID=2905665 RepID=A0ABR1VFN7_9PEZI
MLRTTLRQCFTLLSPAGAPTSRAAAQISGRALWVRNFSEASQSTIQASRTNLSVRQKLPNHASRTRQSILRAPCRAFHRTSRLRRPKTAPKGTNGKNGNANEPQGLSARLKKLSREYGWSAVGVYLAMSILDFPFCFLLVRVVGTDRIGALEHYVVSNAKKLIPEGLKTWWHDYRQSMKNAEQDNFGNDEISEHVEMATWGVEEADARNKAEASKSDKRGAGKWPSLTRYFNAGLGTQLALAYAIHKSFIFIRVPLTAAVTPKVVKVLRSWGWNIGKRVSKTKK